MSGEDFFDDEYAFDVFENKQGNKQSTLDEKDLNTRDNKENPEEPTSPNLYNPYDAFKQEELIKQIQTNYKLDEFEMEHFREEEGCIHEIIRPKGWVVQPKPNTPPAKEYKFTLDPFQVKAIDCIERGESVQVSAHTSAGKTAVAEYAIALALRDKQRVIYTSPIKALSNQKYRELSQIFKDVGQITGDTTLNPTASCQIMTTEILRSMLFRGSEISKEISWVIFDEVHYMRDKERGVAWEETMILCSSNIRYVFLSATIPNAREFAEWICKIKQQPCHVVYTDYRPVPLEHYLFPSGANGIHLIVDDKRNFREESFKKALGSLHDQGESHLIGDKKKKGKSSESASLNKILKQIHGKKWEPVIVFAFSKKEVEAYAMTCKEDLTNYDEKEQVEMLFTNAITSQSDEDKELPQIQKMLPVLKRGIGIHHGGLLPIVKEIIEILFQMGFLKILFSTETFSMGLNMPAKTVVFTSVRKFDGENFRFLTGGEYIQMSGRAGRRGIDDKGITILMIDERMTEDVAQGMQKGQSDRLNSAFHLSYNMLINSQILEDTDPEYIIRRSFHQYQSDKSLPEMGEKQNGINQEIKDINIPYESDVAKLFSIENQMTEFREQIRSIVTSPQNIIPFLAIGRVVYQEHNDMSWGWGAVINFVRKNVNAGKAGKQDKGDKKFKYIIDVMVHIKPRQNKNESPIPTSIYNDGVMEIVPMMITCIKEISSVVMYLPSDLIKAENKAVVKETFKEVTDNFKDDFPILDPIKEMKINDKDLASNITKYNSQKEQRDKVTQMLNKMLTTLTVEDAIKEFDKKMKLEKSIRYLATQIETGQKMVLQDDLKSMKRAMRRLNILSKDDIIELKGRVAGCISSCDEVLMTELVLSGFFNDMTAAEIPAILSAIINDEGNTKNMSFSLKNERLNAYYEQQKDMAKKVAEVFVDCKINIDTDAYMATIKPQLVEVTYMWCSGSSFADILKLTDIFEGNIIRCLKRTEELLQELVNAAKAIGNKDLQEKFETGQNSLVRGIVFAASLYL